MSAAELRPFGGSKRRETTASLRLVAARRRKNMEAALDCAAGVPRADEPNAHSGDYGSFPPAGYM
ncbi:hypothetical protein PF003_g1057 [Phytophthora fragariae]|nr:hypothetical protein PF003_g1057 [Phytophthora fragariae]